MPTNFAATQHYFQLNMLLVDHIIKKKLYARTLCKIVALQCFKLFSLPNLD